VLKRRPSDALLLIATVAVIALVLTAVLALQQLTTSHEVVRGSMGGLPLLLRA